MTTIRWCLRFLAVGAVVAASLKCAHLHAQSASTLLPGMRYAPILPSPRAEPSLSDNVRVGPSESEVSKTIILAELKGMLFVDSSSKIKLIAPEIQGIQTETDHPLLLTRSPCFRPTLERYLNRPLSVGDLQAMQKEITDIYRRHDMPVVGVLVPNQDTSSGTVQIVILEGRVNQINFYGNQYSRSSRLSEQMETQPGSYIYGSLLNEDLRWLNRGGFRDVTVEANPSDEEGLVDLDLKVDDDFPIRSTIGYSDTGTRFLGIERLQVGATYGNVLHMEHQFNYTCSATPDFTRVQVHSYAYMIPFDNRDILSIYGYHGTTVSPLPPPFASEGSLWQLSFRYLKLLSVDSRETSRRERRLTGGFDYKETNSNLDFGGFRVSETFPQIAEMGFGYADSYVSTKGSIDFETELLWSPGEFTGHNDTEAFEQLRYGATADYVYATGRVNATRYMGDKWQWNVNARGQWSDARLIPLEMMGLGGEGSVRGFDTYDLVGDSGWNVSNELATRYMPLGLDRCLRQTAVYGSVRPVEDEFQVFGFFDIGGIWVRDAEPLLLEQSYESLSGTGIGCRYNFGPWIYLRAAYGWRVEDLLLSSVFHDAGRAHIMVTISR
jgi:hemolysin activation/secretion protein